MHAVEENQVQYVCARMAVLNDLQGKGIGSSDEFLAENIARTKEVMKIIKIACPQECYGF